MALKRAARVGIIALIVAGTSLGFPTYSPVDARPAPARFTSLPVAASVRAASVLSTIRELPWRANMLGVSWASADGAEDVVVSVRTRTDNLWSDWTALVVEEDEGPDPGAEPNDDGRLRTLPVWVGTVDAVDVRVRARRGHARLRDVALDLVNTKGDAERVSFAVRAVRAVGDFLTATPTTPSASAYPRKPRIISRAGWGADESLRSSGPGAASKLKMAFVHHTAGTNSYSKAEADDIVRGIYEYHTKANGWSDIGYNFLIDRYGRIYEGRAGGIKEPIIGAHAAGFNTYSSGVALMGNFTSTSPTKAARRALKKLLAWKLDVHHVRPTGRARMTSGGETVRLHRISGHRDVNATACPGWQMYRRLKNIRDAVERRGNPKIYFPRLTVDDLRPDGDGIADTTRLKAGFSRWVDWRWTITDAGGTVLWGMKGRGGRVRGAIWDGVGRDGLPVPPGRYIWRLTATRTKNGHPATPASGTIDVLAPVPGGCAGCAAVAPGGDFNGDGAADLAIGVRGEDVRGTTDAGLVNVIYGSSTGLTGAGDQAWHENKIRLDRAEPGDTFGAALGTGDFNGDGFDDLAVGAPGQAVNGRAHAGAVTVLFGSADGLRRAGAQRFTQNTEGVPGGAEKGDRFGAALAAGDFDGDGSDDLAIGTPNEGLRRRRNAGMVAVLYGSDDRLVPRPGNGWRQGKDGIAGKAERDDLFGASLTVGDLDDNGRDDLVIGVPGEGRGGVPGVGMIHVVLGRAGGLSGTNSQHWYQGSAGVSDTPEAYDRFGFSLAAGDFDGDGKDDVGIGVPGEDAGGKADAGAVAILRGAPEGLSADGQQLDLLDLSGEPATADAFGSSLAARDLDGDTLADLIVGSPGADVDGAVDAGAVTVLYGGDGGLLALGNQRWSLNSDGVQGSAAAGDLLGSAVAAGDFNGDGFAEVVVGVPGRDVSGVKDAGSVTVLPGSPGGVTATGSRSWHQDSSGIRNRAHPADLFGSL